MKRVSVLIPPELLERLRLMKARTGVSESEQIREGIQMWLDSREWPARRRGKSGRTPLLR